MSRSDFDGKARKVDRHRRSVEVTYQGGPLDDQKQTVELNDDLTVMVLVPTVSQASSEYLEATIGIYDLKQDRESREWFAIWRGPVD